MPVIGVSDRGCPGCEYVNWVNFSSVFVQLFRKFILMGLLLQVYQVIKAITINNAIEIDTLLLFRHWVVGVGDFR